MPADDRPRGATLILVGLPGAGKTTVGRGVAARLGWPFVDLDAAIEREAGRSVAEIFAAEGEAGFRERERTATARLAGAGPLVLAPGGGWIENPGCRALLCPPARIIHLRVTPATALERMADDREARPLLAGRDRAGALAALEALRARREPLYIRADFSLDTEGIDLQAVMEKVTALASGEERG